MLDERKKPVRIPRDDVILRGEKMAQFQRVARAIQELEALECEVGRINKRIATVKEILKAA